MCGGSIVCEEQRGVCACVCERRGACVHCAVCVQGFCRAQVAGGTPREPVCFRGGVRFRATRLGAGVAAGTAVVLGAPFGALVFSMEVTAAYYLVSNLWRGLLCCVVCVVSFVLFHALTVRAHGGVRRLPVACARHPPLLVHACSATPV